MLGDVEAAHVRGAALNGFHHVADNTSRLASPTVGGQLDGGANDRKLVICDCAMPDEEAKHGVNHSNLTQHMACMTHAQHTACTTHDTCDMHMHRRRHMYQAWES